MRPIREQCRYLPYLCAFFTALLYLTPTPARSQDDQALFNAGVQAARAGDHTQALEHFRAALRRGLNTTSLYYNLGVTHYHLGQLDGAESAFKRLTRSAKTAGLAYYNLGLVADKRGDEQQAARYFRQAERAARTDKLRRLSRVALSELAPAGTRAPPAAGVWIELGGGYDDNALLVPDETTMASGRSDRLGRLTAYGYAWLGGRPREGLKVEGFLQSERYDELGEFDLDVYQAGPAYRFVAGQWRHTVGAALRRIDLDGEEFQDSHLLNIASSRPLSQPWQLKLSIDFEQIDAQTAFSYLEGDRYALKAGFRRNARQGWRIEYRYELNDRNDLTGADGEFRSFSPASHTVSIKYQRPLARALELSAGLNHRQSRYPDPDVRDDGFAAEREDTRNAVSLGLQYALAGGWRANLEWLFYDNDSNFAEYRYERALTVLSIDKNFGFD